MPLGMQASIFGACPKQDKVGGLGRKGIWRKNRGIIEMGHWIARMEWHPSWWLVCLPLISHLAPWSPEEDIFWHWLTRVVLEKGP